MGPPTLTPHPHPSPLTPHPTPYPNPTPLPLPLSLPLPLTRLLHLQVQGYDSELEYLDDQFATLVQRIQVSRCKGGA